MFVLWGFCLFVVFFRFFFGLFVVVVCYKCTSVSFFRVTNIFNADITKICVKWVVKLYIYIYIYIYPCVYPSTLSWAHTRIMSRLC